MSVTLRIGVCLFSRSHSWADQNPRGLPLVRGRGRILVGFGGPLLPFGMCAARRNCSICPASVLYWRLGPIPCVRSYVARPFSCCASILA
jgi:hypothetical protein